MLDGGVLRSDVTRYRLTPADVQSVPLAVAAYLIVHPRGVLLWDTGAVPDDERAGPAGFEQHLTLADGQDRYVTLGEPLLSQLRAAGYAPSDVTYLAFSHYHWDHTANANAFAGATWLVRPVEREFMLDPNATSTVRPQTYAKLATSKTKLVETDDYDVFGDGRVVLKLAPGHTPGHQVLYLDLPNTGKIVLSGDLYHYPEERSLGRLPTFEVDQEQTRESRAALDEFLAKTGAALWIQHDLVAHRKLKKAPAYYD